MAALVFEIRKEVLVVEVRNETWQSLTLFQLGLVRCSPNAVVVGCCLSSLSGFYRAFFRIILSKEVERLRHSGARGGFHKGLQVSTPFY